MTLITTPDAEADVTLLLTALEKYLSDHFLLFGSISSKARYLEAANHLPDHICEVLVMLLKLDVNSHQYAWLQSTLALVEVSVSICDAHSQFGTLADPQVARATNALRARLVDVFGATNKFLTSWNLSILSGNSTVAKQSSLAYLNLISKMSDVLVSSQYHLGGQRDVNILSETLMRLSKFIDNDLSMFTTLVCIGKAAFFAGQPEAVIPLAFSEEAIVTEATATDILDQDPNLADVMDFYRYYGYCFVTLSVLGDKIMQTYTDLADVFLRVLLNLPNVEMAFVRHVVLAFTTVDREELSFFFLLNTQLRLTSLEQYLRPDSKVREELMYFTSALNARISKDLAHQASPSQSYSSSAISIPNLEHRIGNQATTHNARTLSCILSDGTYKEKVNLVVQFFKSSGVPQLQLLNGVKHAGCLIDFLKLFNLKGAPLFSEIALKVSNEALLHYISNIDGEKYPGKLLYVQAVDKIVKLLMLLSVLHLSDTTGLSSDPDALIAKLVNTGHTFQELAEVKELVFVDGNKFGRKHFLMLEDERIAKQFAILQRTNELEICVQKLM